MTVMVLEETTTIPQPGTIIHGTLRTQDLMPVLLDAVRTYNRIGYYGLTAAAFPLPPAYVVDEGDDSEWWYTADAHDAVAQLIDLLTDVAPDDHYFGAHPGDGSDFGFWPVELLEG